MLTWLLARIMRANPNWTPQKAYSEVQRRVSRVTEMRWNLVDLVADTQVDSIR